MIKTKEEIYESVEDRICPATSEEAAYQAMQEYADLQLTEYKRKLKERFSTEFQDGNLVTPETAFKLIDTTVI